MSAQTSMLTEEIGVAEIAEARKMTRRAARRWLAALERKHPGVVARRDGRMVTTGEQIRPFIKGAPTPPSKLAGEVTRLRGRVEDLERRADRHACDLAEFRLQSNEWFRRHGS